MGKVVKLDETAKSRVASKRTAKQSAASGRRRRPSRTALVLGGGGFTGGVYEIGALRALDLLSVRHTVNEFDIYVGTSAGSFVAAALANGVTPEEMMRVIVQQVPTPFPDARVGSLLVPNYREFVTRGVKFPLRLAQVLLTLARDVGQISAVDVVLGLADALPTGLYSADGIERYVRGILSDPARTNDFRRLQRELYVTATDLDSCERIVFGADGHDAVPISRAVSASSALPMIYKPVRIGERDYIDGGLVSTTNLDIAVERGAKFIVVVNPLVPYVNDMTARTRTLRGWRARRVSDMGFSQIGYQAFKLIAHQRLHEVARRWEERYPGVDIVLIEPEASDELDVSDQRPQLRLAGRGRPPRVRVSHPAARARLSALQAHRRPSRRGDLGQPRPQGGQALRRGAGIDPRVAQDPRADDLDVAASIGRAVAPGRRSALTAAAAAQAPAGASSGADPQALAVWAWADWEIDVSRRLDRNRVLSIRPLKIGTPSSTHLTMTSRRSRPASRASSVGVRWLAMRDSLLCGCSLHGRKYASSPGRAQREWTEVGAPGGRIATVWAAFTKH